MTAGEAIFQALCEAKQLAAAVKALNAAELVEVTEWMEGRAPGEVSGGVWAACKNEAGDRWMKIMKGDRQG